jgi:hypothetical protein
MGMVREEDIQFWYRSKNLWKSGVEMEERQQGECRKLIQTVVLLHFFCMLIGGQSQQHKFVMKVFLSVFVSSQS